MTVMTGWQAVVQAIKSEGIRFVYGLPSSPEDLYDALYDEPSIKAIQVRHEAAGGSWQWPMLTGAMGKESKNPTIFAAP
ncbi:MAG: thiamine pyrophosphate-binding protein [Tepidanaerobacteraceae bacterium]